MAMTTSAERSENLAQSIDSAVKQYCEERGRADTRAKGDGFSIWCLKVVFGFEHDDAVDSLLDGRDDRSIDAVASDGNKLIVLQGKYNSHDWSELTKFRTDAETVLSGSAKELPARLRPAAARLRDQQFAGLPVALYYITNARFTGGDDARIGSLSGDPVVEAWDLDRICDELTERESQRPINAPSHPVRLRPLSILPHGDSLLAPVSLIEFSRFVEDGQRWLFDSNVRQYLSRSKINIGIRETVKTHPDQFWRYNNGVTMVVDKFELADDGSVLLWKPQIVNGCQTSLSIAKVIADMDERERGAIDGSLLLRIIHEDSDDERRNITQFTNRQNAVRGKDFFALKDFQARLKRRIDALGYFYEIQTGSFDMLLRSAKESLKGDSRFSHLAWARRDFRILAIEAAKCHAAAFRGLISVCYSNPGELAPNGEMYDKVFPADLPDEPDLFLTPFLLMKHAEASLGYGSTRGDAWRRRGRYVFVWAAFRLLTEALQAANRLDAGEDLGVGKVALVRAVCTTPDLTDQLVALADRVLDGYFSDSAIFKLINTDIFAFLKGPIEKKDSIEILDMKVRAALDGAAGRHFVESLREAIPA